MILKRAFSSRPARQNIEYLFGANVVLPALEQAKRKLVCLYIRQDERFGGLKLLRDGEISMSGRPLTAQSLENGGWDVIDYAVGLASRREVQIKEAPASQLSRLSGDRPHQGLVLAAHAPKTISLRAMQACSLEGTDKMNEHQAGAVRFEAETLQSGTVVLETTSKLRAPFMLALDQIVDPQNLGAILRSALFFGVDGVVLTENETAPISPVCSKASAGAMEVMNLFTTSNLSNFLQESASNGWQILGTDIGAQKNAISLSAYRRLWQKSGNPSAPITGPVPLPVQDIPTILVLGNEGRGMRKLVSRQCDYHIHISSAVNLTSNRQAGLDSLNISNG
eukprot:jgi/Hompol1/2390/HPOL_002923-RA